MWSARWRPVWSSHDGNSDLLAWLVLAGVAVAELHEWREPEAESREGVHFLVLQKRRCRETYVFLFVDATTLTPMRAYGRFASDPSLSFSWGDAAIASSKTRKMVKG